MQPKTRIVLLIVLVLGILFLGGTYAGYRGYKSIRQNKLIKQARTYLAAPDRRKAALCLQRALSFNPKDIDACRMMAELAETDRSPVAMVYRTRVVELEPHSTENRLALVRTAMIFRDYASATNALEGVDAVGKKTAEYHNLAGTVAAAASQPANAETHFVEAARLEPMNPAFQLNLAVVRLHETNDSGWTEARGALMRLSTNSADTNLRCRALRELTVDSMRHKQTDTALALSARLLQETNAVFQDRLLRLAVLRDTRSAEYRPALANFQHEAANEPAKAAELGVWQMSNSSANETLAWLSSLPRETQTNQAVAMLMAECYTKLGDWRGLQALVETENWGELEFVRHAFKTYAFRGQSLNGAAKSEWELALKIASNQKASLVMLLQMAAAWDWQSEGEELLWTIVNRYSEEHWAFQALAQNLYAGGRTRSLMMLYSQQLKRSPADLGTKNNLALLAFLLEAKELRPHDLAREVYLKASTNAAYASTYAFSLHLQDKDAEALKIFQSLKPLELQDPSIAGYYGLVLKATGDQEKSRAYLDWAFQGRMLPEERKLFERAKAGV